MSGKSMEPSHSEAAKPQQEHAWNLNPGMPLDLDWVESVAANTSAIERRAAGCGTGQDDCRA